MENIKQKQNQQMIQEQNMEEQRTRQTFLKPLKTVKTGMQAGMQAVKTVFKNIGNNKPLPPAKQSNEQFISTSATNGFATALTPLRRVFRNFPDLRKSGKVPGETPDSRFWYCMPYRQLATYKQTKWRRYK